MTVAIGLVCKDGVIVASDSMASTTTGAAVDAVKVAHFAHNPVVWTGAGSVYVKEEVEVEIASKLDAKPEDVFSEPKVNLLRAKVKSVVHPTVAKCYKSALATTAHAPGTIAKSMAASFLFAGYANGEPWLLEFDQDGSLNWHTDRRFYAVGSGGHSATVCYALMKHYVADDLILEEGMQLAYRAIETTCDVSSSSVGLPVQMAVVDGDGPRMLEESDISRVGVAVARWKELGRDTLRLGSDDSAPDELPSMSS